MQTKQVVIIGGGAAGMMSAALAACPGMRVTIVEKNEKLGKKLFITGKGRCNFTNQCTPEEFLENVVSNPRFLYSAVSRMTPDDVITCFREWGLDVKVERGRRVFPSSDKSSDVIDTLKTRLRALKVRVLLDTPAAGIKISDGKVTGVRIRKEGRETVLPADFVIVASGGVSYPSTGSTGDGFRFAAEAGHHVTALCPSLVPVSCAEEYVRSMQGLSLKNVELHVKKGKKEVFRGFGEMMFTHFGVTGPLVLSASAKIGPLIGRENLETWIDLKPKVTEEMLDQRILRLISENPAKEVKNAISGLYPSLMQPVLPELAGIDPARRMSSLSKAEREKIIRATKHFPITLTSLRGFNEAVVTKGGVSVKEIVPSSMESRLVGGLYFAGEVLDLDAYTGGYNLQIAWSTAAAAAKSIREKCDGE